jgi:hypothetical protein
MSAQFVDSPPADWFVLDVMKRHWRKWDWVALMIDVDPDNRAYRPARECWLRIPGKHRSRDAAWNALEDMMATRH